MINISLGSVSIPFGEVLHGLFGQSLSKASWEHILFHFRIPKSITAISTGAGLSAVGLLMQTLFKNPMAGPAVLGISSGAGLGVALLVMGGSFFGWESLINNNLNTGTVLAAIIGAFIVLSFILFLSNKIKNTLSILIIGLMLSALTTAIIGILSFFSKATQLQQYIFWGFGSLGHLSQTEIWFLSGIVVLGIIGILPLLKPLNGLLLGENYAKSTGVNLKRTKNYTLLISGLITGIITAYVGPIAFIGLAVPHITRLIFNTSNHRILLPAVLFIGAIILLVCDTIAQLPMSENVLPINAITSLFGAPLVIWLLIRQKKYHF